jgi:hypothetical protein
VVMLELTDSPVNAKATKKSWTLFSRKEDMKKSPLVSNSSQHSTSVASVFQPIGQTPPRSQNLAPEYDDDDRSSM